MLTDKIILQRYAPATVLVNNKGDILYITGRTGKYLEPPAGKANWNIFAMAREGLNYALSNAFYQSLRQQQEVTIRNVMVLNEGGSQMVDIIFYPINEPPALQGTVLIIIKDLPPILIDESAMAGQLAEAKTRREAELELELVQFRSMWQASSAEMQVSQEELKSSNEELQSTNEELQSTNEELCTTKEEIQSLNEELNMANDELLAKIDELELINNDMQNLMDSTNIATLFLNRSLLVNSFTKQMSAISKLINKDVGRPVTDIASKLFYPELAKDVNEVLRTLGMVEKQVQSDEGKWFDARILPYRTLKGEIDGVVITFMDISESKALEAELRHAKTLLDERFADQGRELAQANKKLRLEYKQGLRETAATTEKPAKARPKKKLE